MQHEWLAHCGHELRFCSHFGSSHLDAAIGMAHFVVKGFCVFVRPAASGHNFHGVALLDLIGHISATWWPVVLEDGKEINC